MNLPKWEELLAWAESYPSCDGVRLLFVGLLRVWTTESVKRTVGYQWALVSGWSTSLHERDLGVTNWAFWYGKIFCSAAAITPHIPSISNWSSRRRRIT